VEPSFLEKNGKTILIGMGGLLGVALVVWWYFFYDMRLTVAVTPSSAAVMLDGIDVTGQKQVKLKPGSHTLKVTLNDYLPLEQTIQAKSNTYVTLPVTLTTLPHLTLVTKDSTTSTSFDATNHKLYYRNTSANDAERIDLASGTSIDSSSVPKPQVLTPGALTGIDEWLWGPGYDLGLMRQGNKWSLYSFNRFDLVHQSTSSWPDGVGSVAWNPTNVNQLAHYFAPTGGEQTLIQTDPQHQTTNRIFNFLNSAVSAPKVAWVGDGSDMVLLSKEGRLWRFTVYNKTLTAITQSENVSDMTTSPDGKTILAKQADGNLFLIGIDGSNKRAIDGSLPLAQFAWSADSQSLWMVTNGDSLGITKLTVADGSKTAYSMANKETVGTIHSISVTDDNSRMALAGSSGLGLVRLEPSTYPTLTLK